MVELYSMSMWLAEIVQKSSNAAGKDKTSQATYPFHDYQDAKKKQAVRDERVSYLQVAPL